MSSQTAIKAAVEMCEETFAGECLCKKAGLPFDLYCASVRDKLTAHLSVERQRAADAAQEK